MRCAKLGPVLLFVVAVPLLVLGQMGKMEMDTSEDQTSGRLSLKPPDLSDEESHAVTMPRHLRCDGCRAIAVRMKKAIQERIEMFPSVREGRKELRDEELMELVEEGVCEDKEWSGHGVKQHQGVTHLVHPGHPVASEPGIMAGGGAWPRRLSLMCHEMLGDHDEREIYDAHRSDPVRGIERLLCSGMCPEKKKRRKKSGKSEL